LLAAVCALVSADLPADYPTVPMKGIEGDMKMPLVGLGTWQYKDDVAEQATIDAFKLGYRHVDTALGYGNQVGVGKALKQVGLKREDYFVTSKIPGGTDAATTTANLEKAMETLQLDYVDLMLVHYPATWGGEGGAAMRKEEWLAMEKWAKTGKAKAIGISHYCKSHTEDVLSVATVPISLNQVMYHVGMGNSPDVGNDYKDYMKSKGIVYMSFSTLCGPCDGDDKTELITGPLVTKIGNAHNVTGPQVALKWAVQQGIPVVPKSDKPAHMAQNLDLFSFTLSDSEMAELTASKTPASGAAVSGDCGVAAFV